jgi:S1-C subfamily serine protease
MGAQIKLAGVIAVVALAGAQSAPALKNVPLPASASFVWTDAAAPEIARHIEQQAWTPVVNAERPRGGPDIYAKVAPAVVAVRTDSGHGTGFFVDAKGLVLTNHHVVGNSLWHDAAKRGSFASIFMGRIGKDGVMTLRDQPVKAYLVKSDPVIDLALLRLESVPADVTPLPVLSLAAAAPRPGGPATIIGHPASGMLWTMRSGEVASVGRMPADLVDLVMTRLAFGPQQQKEAAEDLRTAPSRRIILTSAGANPGDSGGPVVDATGAVIAVTFAVPSDPARAKFSYHVHLDEIRQFLAKVPATAMFDLPDPWQLGPRVALQDLDGDRKPDALVAGVEGVEQILFDLDNDSVGPLTDVGAIARGKKWDFEFAMRLSRSEPTSTAFYDTNNDGTVDLIFTVDDDNHAKNSRFTRAADGSWRLEQNVSMTLASATPLNPKLGERLASLLKRFQQR